MAPRLSFRRLELESDVKLEAGDVAKPLATKYNHATPIECLKWQLKKKTIGEDVGDDAVLIDTKQYAIEHQGDDAAFHEATKFKERVYKDKER